ncbi:hypothetical protein ANO14919_023900 [Xylariales sp. No.14919]|nr:hypothetical protein ANO14919_023900 [Xylariales sp. No.14919]
MASWRDKHTPLFSEQTFTPPHRLFASNSPWHSPVLEDSSSCK